MPVPVTASHGIYSQYANMQNQKSIGNIWNPYFRNMSGICLVYTMYMQISMIYMAYTWYILGYTMYIQLTGYTWYILGYTIYIHKYIHGISFDVNTRYIRGISWYIHGYS
jgi:hypothetical protein